MSDRKFGNLVVLSVKISLILAIFYMQTALAQNQSYYDIIKAIGEGKVKLEDIRGNGTNMGMSLVLSNNTEKDINVKIPRGLILDDIENVMQDMIVIRSQVINLKVHQIDVLIELDTYCLEEDIPPPADAPSQYGASYSLKPPKEEGELFKLLSTFIKMESKIYELSKEIEIKGNTISIQGASEEEIEIIKLAEWGIGEYGVQGELHPSLIQASIWAVTENYTEGELGDKFRQDHPDWPEAKIEESARNIAERTQYILDMAGIKRKFKG